MAAFNNIYFISWFILAVITGIVWYIWDSARDAYNTLNQKKYKDDAKLGPVVEEAEWAYGMTFALAIVLSLMLLVFTAIYIVNGEALASFKSMFKDPNSPVQWTQMAKDGQFIMKGKVVPSQHEVVFEKDGKSIHFTADKPFAGTDINRDFKAIVPDSKINKVKIMISPTTTGPVAQVIEVDGDGNVEQMASERSGPAFSGTSGGIGGGPFGPRPTYTKYTQPAANPVGPKKQKQQKKQNPQYPGFPFYPPFQK